MSNIAPTNVKPPISSANLQAIRQAPPTPPKTTGGDSKKPERKDLTKKKIKWNYIIGIVVLLLLIIGGGAGFWLTKQRQDIRQQAAEVDYEGSCSWGSAANCQGGNPGDSCGGDGICRELPNQTGTDGKAKCTCDRPDDPSPSPSCREECPGSDGILRNCTPPEGDGTPEESICNRAGRIESCGGTSYCCPRVGGNWTTNMTACQTASPSPTPSSSPSPSPSPSSSPDVSPSPSPSSSPDASVSPSPSSSSSTAYSCNSSCIANSQCQATNANYICYLGQCRLDSNPNSDQCASSTGTSTQPDLPTTLPESGSEDVLDWLKAGLGVLGIGTVLLLLL